MIAKGSFDESSDPKREAAACGASMEENKTCLDDEDLLRASGEDSRRGAAYANSS